MSCSKHSHDLICTRCTRSRTRSKGANGYSVTAAITSIKGEVYPVYPFQNVNPITSCACVRACVRAAMRYKSLVVCWYNGYNGYTLRESIDKTRTYAVPIWQKERVQCGYSAGTAGRAMAGNGWLTVIATGSVKRYPIRCLLSYINALLKFFSKDFYKVKSDGSYPGPRPGSSSQSHIFTNFWGRKIRWWWFSYH